MANQSTHPDLSNEQRYMALLALTSQELPAKPERDAQGTSKDLSSLSSEEWESLYRRLDANPEALDAFLRLEKQKVAITSAKQAADQPVGRIGQWLSDTVAECVTWIAGPRVRYAAAFGVTAIIAMLVIVQQVPRSSLVMTVEQGFADVEFRSVNGSLDGLLLPWEHPPGALGFAAASSNDVASARAFANGLLRGKHRVSSSAGAPLAVNVASSDADAAPYVALGEWNVLVWAACESEPLADRDFWRRQEDVARKLAAADYAQGDTAAIAKHLSSAIDMLAVLARAENTKRNARRLADELVRFREALAPHDATVVLGAP